jgi:hypothetical protein
MAKKVTLEETVEKFMKSYKLIQLSKDTFESIDANEFGNKETWFMCWNAGAHFITFSSWGRIYRSRTPDRNSIAISPTGSSIISSNKRFWREGIRIFDKVDPPVLAWDPVVLIKKDNLGMIFPSIYEAKRYYGENLRLDNFLSFDNTIDESRYIPHRIMDVCYYYVNIVNLKKSKSSIPLSPATGIDQRLIFPPIVTPEFEAERRKAFEIRKNEIASILNSRIEQENNNLRESIKQYYTLMDQLKIHYDYIKNNSIPLDLGLESFSKELNELGYTIEDLELIKRDVKNIRDHYEYYRYAL